MYIRINSQGVVLSQADFAMSKKSPPTINMAAPKSEKMIDYFFATHAKAFQDYEPNHP